MNVSESWIPTVPTILVSWTASHVFPHAWDCPWVEVMPMRQRFLTPGSSLWVVSCYRCDHSAEVCLRRHALMGSSALWVGMCLECHTIYWRVEPRGPA